MHREPSHPRGRGKVGTQGSNCEGPFFMCCYYGLCAVRLVDSREESTQGPLHTRKQKSNRRRQVIPAENWRKFENMASHIFANYYGSLLRSGPIKWGASRNARRSRGERSYCQRARAHAIDGAPDVPGLVVPADGEEPRPQASPRGDGRVQVARASRR